MFRPIAICLAAALLMLALLIAAHTPAGTQTQVQAAMLQQIREKAELTCLEIEQSVIVTRELNGYTGGVKTCIVVVGVVKIGCDLGQARFEQVAETARTAVLVLPAPRVLDVKIDLAKTQIYSVDRTGLWRVLPFAVREEQVIQGALREAEAALRSRCPADQIEVAKNHLHEFVTDLAEPLHWSVIIQWGDETCRHTARHA